MAMMKKMYGKGPASKRNKMGMKKMGTKMKKGY